MNSAGRGAAPLPIALFTELLFSIKSRNFSTFSVQRADHFSLIVPSHSNKRGGGKLKMKCWLQSRFYYVTSKKRKKDSCLADHFGEDLCKQVLSLISFKFRVSMYHHLHTKGCKALARGIQGVTIPGRLQKTCRCGSWGHGLVVNVSVLG